MESTTTKSFASLFNMAVINSNLAELLNSELNQVRTTEEVDLAALLESNLNMTPSRPSPSPPSSSQNVLDSLLRSDLNSSEVAAEVHLPSPQPTFQQIALDDLLLSDLNSVPISQDSPDQDPSHNETLHGLLTSDLNSPALSAISRKRTLDQLLESDLNISPSCSESPVREPAANRPRTLTPPLESPKLLSQEQRTLDILLDSELNGDPQPDEGPMDGLDGEEMGQEGKWYFVMLYRYLTSAEQICPLASKGR